MRISLLKIDGKSYFKLSGSQNAFSVIPFDLTVLCGYLMKFVKPKSFVGIKVHAVRFYSKLADHSPPAPLPQAKCPIKLKKIKITVAK